MWKGSKTLLKEQTWKGNAGQLKTSKSGTSGVLMKKCGRLQSSTQTIHLVNQEKYVLPLSPIPGRWVQFSILGAPWTCWHLCRCDHQHKVFHLHGSQELSPPWVHYLHSKVHLPMTKIRILKTILSEALLMYVHKGQSAESLHHKIINGTCNANHFPHVHQLYSSRQLLVWSRDASLCMSEIAGCGNQRKL